MDDDKNQDQGDRRLLLETMQGEKRMLQDNISLRVMYGWALIAVLAALIMAISIPTETTLHFEPRDMYVLSLVCLALAILFVFLALFMSHYGSSYRLFRKDERLRSDDILEIERDLHKKTLYKNQLSSLYSGLSLLMTFVGVMVLVASSNDNALNDMDPMLIMLAVGCMFFAGSFFKKRMYRIYQIRRDKLPGLNLSSTSGYIGHLTVHLFHWIIHQIRKLIPQHSKTDPLVSSEKLQASNRADGFDFVRDPNIREMSYGITIVLISTVIILATIILGNKFEVDALNVTIVLFLGAMLGFVAKQVHMTVVQNVDPTHGETNVAAWNPMFTKMLIVIVTCVLVLAPVVLMAYGMDNTVTDTTITDPESGVTVDETSEDSSGNNTSKDEITVFPFVKSDYVILAILSILPLTILLLFYIYLRTYNNYLRAIRLNGCYMEEQELVLDETHLGKSASCQKIKFSYQKDSNTIVITLDGMGEDVLSKHECRVIRLAVERILSIDPKPGKIKIQLPGKTNRIIWKHGRGDVIVDYE